MDQRSCPIPVRIPSSLAMVSSWCNPRRHCPNFSLAPYNMYKPCHKRHHHCNMSQPEDVPLPLQHAFSSTVLIKNDPPLWNHFNGLFQLVKFLNWISNTVEVHSIGTKTSRKTTSSTTMSKLHNDEPLDQQENIDFCLVYEIILVVSSRLINKPDVSHFLFSILLSPYPKDRFFVDSCPNDTRSLQSSRSSIVFPLLLLTVERRRGI